MTNLLEADLKAWLAGAGAAAIEQKGGDAAQLVPARNELQRRRARGDTVNLLPALLAIGNNAVARRAEAVETLSEASRIAAAARAPATAQLAIDLALREAGQKRFDVGAKRAFLRETLARPAVAGDPRAAAAVRLLLAEPAYRTAAPADATALLTDVATDTRLVANDTFRVSALVRRASLEANRGDLVAARASYDKTGLDAQQCALVDARPVVRSEGGFSSDFPNEAMRWGFEGWVKVEYDITAAGRTAAQRTVIAYSPFVFRDAGIGVIKQARYVASFRPGGDAGCGGAQKTVRFQINR